MVQNADPGAEAHAVVRNVVDIDLQELGHAPRQTVPSAPGRTAGGCSPRSGTPSRRCRVPGRAVARTASGTLSSLLGRWSFSFSSPMVGESFEHLSTNPGEAGLATVLSSGLLSGHCRTTTCGIRFDRCLDERLPSLPGAAWGTRVVTRSPALSDWTWSRSNSAAALAEVIARTGLSRNMIHVRLVDDPFPWPVSRGQRALAWIESELDE